ncbi:MAG: gfo/Idh/MocA family oxidoreductase [Candidatus Omnitrophica bacterium]|nr:gfo/Idh/MocA family oxidoreductase [Candidatus Omnitrophota bacterium]
MTEKTEKLKVGIAGYGVVGERRRQFIDTHPEFATAALCDRKFAGRGTMPDGVRFYSDYKRLLEEDLDVLFVCLPNYLAAEVTVAALNKGLHVFCEKPPGRDVGDIRRVMEAEKDNPGLILKYGFNHRYHDSVREALKIIKSGELGEVINLRGVYGKSRIIPFSGGWRAERSKAGGGILLDQGIHMVDLMCLFCGAFRDIKSYVSSSYWRHDVEDNAFALMRDAQGRVAMLHSSATQWEHRFTLDIALTEGYLELQGILSGSKSYGQEKLVIGKRSEGSNVGTLQERTINYLEDNSWRDEIDEFAGAVVKGESIEHGTSEEALRTMETVYRIYYADPEWREKYGIPDPDA